LATPESNEENGSDLFDEQPIHKDKEADDRTMVHISIDRSKLSQPNDGKPINKKTSSVDLLQSSQEKKRKIGKI
jgi:hypothetical protein